MSKSNQLIQRFDFQKNKYGKELLVDLGRVENLKNYVLDRDLHYVTFYEILVITEGLGTYSLDDEVIKINQGTVIVTLPNQIRQWKIDETVNGYCFFFEGEFLNKYFRDEVFLNRFAVFDYSRPLSYTRLEGEEFGKLLSILSDVESEFLRLRGDSSHIFRSLLYYVISLIDRKYRDHHQINNHEAHQIIYRFKKLLNENFYKWHTVAQYANKLGISHNYLNSLCKNHFSKTSLQIIHDRILLEAKRELEFSTKTVSEIAFSLGFSDVSNFNRMFKRLTGYTPKTYRLNINQRQ